MGRWVRLDLGVKRMDELLDEYGAEDGLRVLWKPWGTGRRQLMRSELEGAARRALGGGRFPRQRRDPRWTRPEDHAWRLEICGRPDDAGFRMARRRSCAGPVNIALPTTVATAYVAIKHIFQGLPANAGVMRPIDREGARRLNPVGEFPAPTGGYTETILRMIDVIFLRLLGRPRRTGWWPMPMARSTRCRLRASAQRPALGDVFLLWRRARRIARKATG